MHWTLEKERRQIFKSELKKLLSKVTLPKFSEDIFHFSRFKSFLSSKHTQLSLENFSLRLPQSRRNCFATSSPINHLILQNTYCSLKLISRLPTALSPQHHYYHHYLSPLQLFKLLFLLPSYLHPPLPGVDFQPIVLLPS